MQYRTGLVSVSRGSATVTLSGGSFAGTVKPGDLLTVGPDQPVGVVAAVPDGGTLLLEAPWPGDSRVDAPYAVVRDFDPASGAPLLAQGDVWPHLVINRAINRLGLQTGVALASSAIVGEARTARDEAQGHAAAAAAAAAAQASGDRTLTAADRIATSDDRAAAEAARDAAMGYRGDALQSAATAQSWAANPVDAPIPTAPGQYSAYHWAMRSQDSAAQAAAIVGGSSFGIIGDAHGPVFTAPGPSSMLRFVAGEGIGITADAADQRLTIRSTAKPLASLDGSVLVGADATSTLISTAAGVIPFDPASTSGFLTATTVEAAIDELIDKLAAKSTTLAGYGITDAVGASALGAAGGVATLGPDGKLPAAQLPALAIGETFVVASEAEMLALAAQKGDIAIRTDLGAAGRTLILAGDDPAALADWTPLAGAGDVTAVFGRTGMVTAQNGDYTAAQISFSPVGGLAATTAQAAIEALEAGKAGLGGAAFTGPVTGPLFQIAEAAGEPGVGTFTPTANSSTLTFSHPQTLGPGDLVIGTSSGALISSGGGTGYQITGTFGATVVADQGFTIFRAKRLTTATASLEPTGYGALFLLPRSGAFVLGPPGVRLAPVASRGVHLVSSGTTGVLSSANMTLVRYSDDNFSGAVSFYKARGTWDNPQPVAFNDIIGRFNFLAYGVNASGLPTMSGGGSIGMYTRASHITPETVGPGGVVGRVPTIFAVSAIDSLGRDQFPFSVGADPFFLSAGIAANGNGQGGDIVASSALAGTTASGGSINVTGGNATGVGTFGGAVTVAAGWAEPGGFAGNLRLRGGGGGGLPGVVYVETGHSPIARFFWDQDGNYVPEHDAAYDIGRAPNRIRNLYLSSGVISTSDIRAKRDVQPLDLGLDFVKAVAPIRYTRSDADSVMVTPPVVRDLRNDQGVVVGVDVTTKAVYAPSAGSRTHFGFSAQGIAAQLDAATPQGAAGSAVWTLDDPADPDSRQGLRADQLVPILWNAVRELAAEVERLKAAASAEPARKGRGADGPGAG